MSSGQVLYLRKMREGSGGGGDYAWSHHSRSNSIHVSSQHVQLGDLFVGYVFCFIFIYLINDCSDDQLIKRLFLCSYFCLLVYFS